MKTRTYFAFRIDVWDDAGNSIFELKVLERQNAASQLAGRPGEGLAF